MTKLEDTSTATQLDTSAGTPATVANGYGVYFNVAGWYELTPFVGSVVKINAAVGTLIPGRWKSVKTISTPNPTTALTCVVLSG